jgi:hypothetical protein
MALVPRHLGGALTLDGDRQPGRDHFQLDVVVERQCQAE